MDPAQEPQAVFGLDNMMLYWLANAGGASARLFWESLADAALSEPVAVSLFPYDVTYVVRGGNLIDTSVNYTNGTSERVVGALAKASANGSCSPPSSPWRAIPATRTPAATTG